jgi:hypothetical protein
MAESTTSVSSSSSAQASAAQANAAANQAESLAALAEAGGATTTSSVTSSTTVNSLDQLRTADPKLYNLMINGIMQNMLISFNDQEQGLETAMKQLGQDDEN